MKKIYVFGMLVLIILVNCRSESNDMTKKEYNQISKKSYSLYYITQEQHVWGGYGSYLSHGMILNFPEQNDNQVKIERVGPYIDRVTLPSSQLLVLSDDAKNWLVLRENQLNVYMHECVKSKITNLSWRDWSGVEPEKWPLSGAPEGYTVEGDHCIEADKKIGVLWYWKPIVLDEYISKIDNEGNLIFKMSIGEQLEENAIIRVGYKLYATSKSKTLLSQLNPIPIEFKEVKVSIE